MTALPVVHGPIASDARAVPRDRAWVGERSGMEREVVVGAIARLGVVITASLPMFAVVAVAMRPYETRVDLRIWLIVGMSAALLSVFGSLTMRRHLRRMGAGQLRVVVVLLFGIPLAAAWGSLNPLVRPESEHVALLVAMFVLAMAAAVHGSTCHLGPVSTLMAASIVGPNWITSVLDHGLSAPPSVLIAYGGTAAFAIQMGMRRDLESLLAEASQDLSARNAELEWRATHDRLMGIPNRDLLEVEMKAAIEVAQANPDGPGVGLLFLDLDRFKFVNDTLGHSAGDSLLVAVGRRLESALADEDAVVARVGGDELVVLMRCLTSDGHLGLVADKLLDKFLDPFSVDGLELSIGSSIGMAIAEPGDTAEDLYRHADAALYEAKQRGRGRAVFADHELRDERKARLRTESALRMALEQRSIEAWLQPEVDLVTGEVVGAEALARWRMGSGVAPAQTFIGTAERAGLLDELTAQILHQVQSWALASGCDLPIGINVAAAQIPTLIELSSTADSATPLAGLRVEMTETDLHSDLGEVAEMLTALRQLGAKVVLDDFGAEVTSLKLLSELPIDGLKIDGSFVARLDDDRVRQLVTSVAEFGRSCDIAIVAEGVETDAQAEFLRQIGVDRAQGHLFGPAVDPADFGAIAAAGFDARVGAAAF